MKKLLSFFILTLFQFSLWAHSPTDNNLALAEEVYNRLQKAVGDYSRDWPEIQLRTSPSSVLAYNRRKNILFIDQKALDICKSFKAYEKDALAFLIGHEVTHFYQEHDWKESGFASTFLVKHSTFNQYAKDEKEADLYGAFIAYLANYNSLKIIPQLLDEIYTQYELQDNIKDYPSLAQRKSVAVEICAKVQELITIFETANHLSAIGEYTSSASCYEYVLQFIKCKELYNNLGASLVASASLLFEGKGYPFKYPLLMDANLPMRDGLNTYREQLLERAIFCLEKATLQDPTYYRGFINLASAYELAGAFRKSKILIDRLKNLVANPQETAAIYVLEGIQAARQNNDLAAIQFFEKAAVLSSDEGFKKITQYNLNILNGISNSETFINTQFIEMETIDNLDLMFENEFDFQEIVLEKSFSDENKKLLLKDLPNSLLIHFIDSEKTVAIQTTKQARQKTITGVKLGTRSDELKKIYPNEIPKILLHNRGSFWVYSQHNLIFNVDSNEKITTWGVFTSY